MGLTSIGLLSGATLAASGGTALTLTTMANPSEGVRVADATVADFRLRPTATFRSIIPVQNRDGSYSKDRRNASFVTPLFDSVSEVYENGVIRIERVLPAFATPAQALHLNYIVAQLLFDTDTASFWSTGSYA